MYISYKRILVDRTVYENLSKESGGEFTAKVGKVAVNSPPYPILGTEDDDHEYDTVYFIYNGL